MMKKYIMILALCTLVSGCTSRAVANEAEVASETEVSVQVTSIESEDVESSTQTIQNPDDFQNLSEEDEAARIASNIVFEYIDTPRDERIERIVNRTYWDITDDFELTFDDEIKVIVYKDQPSFWAGAFGGENNSMTTGFADHVDKVIHLISPTDLSLKSEEEMLKLPAHELVHIILPHGYIDIREGLACYLADQIKPYSLGDIPADLSSIVTYQGSGEVIRMQYNLAAYKTKFMIEECLNKDFVKYKQFMDSPDDYTLLGYEDEVSLLEDFRRYLEEQTD